MFNFDVEGVFSSGVDNLTKALSELSANYKQDSEEFQVNHTLPEVLDFSVFKNDKTIAKRFTVKPFNTPGVEGVGKHVKETLTVNKSPILDPLTTVMEGINYLIDNPQVNLNAVNFPEILNTFLAKPSKAKPKPRHGNWLGNDQFVFFDRYKILPAFINSFLNNMHIQRYFYLTLSDWTIIQAIHIPAAILIGGALGGLAALPLVILSPLVSVLLISLATTVAGLGLTIVISALVGTLLWIVMTVVIVAITVVFIFIVVVAAIAIAIATLVGFAIVFAIAAIVIGIGIFVAFWSWVIGSILIILLTFTIVGLIVAVGATAFFGFLLIFTFLPIALTLTITLSSLFVLVSAIIVAFIASAFIKLIGRPHFLHHSKHKKPKHAKRSKAPKDHHKKSGKHSHLKPVAPRKHAYSRGKHNTELITSKTSRLQVVLTSEENNREVLLEPTVSKPLVTVSNPLLNKAGNQGGVPVFDSPHQLPVNVNNLDVKVMQAFTQFLVMNDFFIKEFTTNFHPAGLYPTDINTDGDTLGDPANDDDTVVAEDNNTNTNDNDEGDWVTAGDGMMCAPNDGGGVDCHPITPSDEKAMNQAVAEQQQAANPTPVVVTPLPTAANPNPTPKVITPKPHKVYPTPLTGLVERIDYYVHLNIKTGRNSKWFNFIEQVFGTSKHPGPYRFILLATAGLLDNM